MGVKLMTGATGEQNIEAADDRECLAGLTGVDSYVFDTRDKLKATLVNANTVTIGTGAGSMQGSRFRCPTATTVTIKSGTQGQYRHDIIGLHFSRAASGKESLEFQVLTGTPASSDGAANDPAYKVGNLLKGDANAFFPLYRVKLSGINAANPEAMFPVLTSLKTLGDSVAKRASRVFTGSMHRSTSNNGWILLWNADQVKSEFGVAVTKIIPVCVNNAAGASDIWIEQPVMTGSGTWYALCVCRDSNGWVKAVGGGISVPVSYRVEIVD